MIKAGEELLRLQEENKKLKDGIDRAIEEIKELPTRGSVGMDGTICRNEVLEILKRNIGGQNDGPTNRESETVSS